MCWRFDCGWGGTAHANLITNGDFSSGFAGWATNGNVTISAGATTLGMDGNYALFGQGTTTGTDTLSQTFSVSGLSAINISFNYYFIGFDGSVLNDEFLSLYAQGTGIVIKTVTLQDLLSSGGYWDPQTYTLFGTYSTTIDLTTLMAYDPTGELAFQLIESLDGFSGFTESTAGIDSVSVNSVPEPMCIMLLGCGLLGLGVFKLRRETV